MISPYKILAVDDDPAILRMYRELLTEAGLDVHTATTIDEAVTALDQGDWSVVLLDQRLHGADSSDEGLTLVAEVDRRSPGAKCIIVTGYASSETIEQAFAAGAYDYIEKTQTFATLLRAKVRNATELARERSLASLNRDQVSMELARLWQAASTEANSARKGLLLEDLIELLLGQVPGFVVAKRRRSIDEEFDLVVRNESADPLWSKESQYFIVECKNWSSKVDPVELDRFVEKIDRRYGRAKFGFFVAVNGFTAGFKSTLAANRKGDVLVIPLDGGDIKALVEAEDREALLKQHHQRAIEGSSS